MHRVTDHTDESVIATWENIVLRVGGGEPTVAHMAAIERAVQSADQGDGVGFVLWLPAGAPAPDADARGRAVEMFREVGTRIQAFAAIIEGSGFRVSALRSVLTGFNLVARFPFPFKTFDSFDAGSAWFLNWVRPRIDPATFRRLAEGVRDEIEWPT